ncbi:hypothetical protein [Streptomyces sp. NPDC019937]|uniref:hypothetical protein n=1 Tax=Streptomyces sp. NPDC019937 TaxID=3154787 RepID=UPI0033C0D7D7
MTTTRSFLGIPVEGEITQGEDRKKQRPLEELQPILQAVLDDPTILEFGWRQYTPYFNDGDPCTFNVHGVWIRTDADRDVEDTYELEPFTHPSIGKVTGGEWVEDADGPRKRVGARYEGPDQARFERCKALEAAVEGGEFYDVLLDAFGDHARVTVRRDGIEIEFYDHD